MKENDLRRILSVNNRNKKGITVVLIFVTNLALTGCVTYFAATYDSPPSNLGVVKEGSDRKTVESVLGKPKQKNNNVYTYEYNTREIPPLWTAIFLDVGSFGTSALIYGDLKDGEKAGKAKMRIVFGPNGTVINLNYDDAERTYLRWVNSSNRNEEIELLCISANSGYAPAQAIQGMMYRYGLWGAEIDNVKAYRWLKLADFTGQHNVKEVMTGWSRNMTSEEIEQAEKSFREWEPESCKK